MIDNVYFFNNFHNGDIFYSKEFVIDIKNKIGQNHYYIHNNDFSILKDIDIQQIRKNLSNKNEISIEESDKDLYINTWIGQQKAKYLSTANSGCNLNTNYNMFCDIYKQLSIEINPIEYYIPAVDFQKVQTTNIDNFIKPNKKYILICNNNVCSGQSENFNFDPIIDYLSTTFPDLIFIITNNTYLNKNNIFNFSDIVGINNNLLEISYISTKCDVIIGRASGPFCFTHIKENIKNPNKTFVGFSYGEAESKWVSDNNCQAKQYWSNNFDISFINKYLSDILKNI